ncbi:hypothetical protein MtrunA17_Chr5g0414101 [Medicago truncatula]|uniref:Transmembrane protein n=1 Tax=Medicago truncatula TaxID=3880 RepID=A0A396HRE0_MEDTR|nr:hypothetical protein MtrunA17_Chr5g0414101 [Medicago truncatula]
MHNHHCLQLFLTKSLFYFFAFCDQIYALCLLPKIWRSNQRQVEI